MKVQLSSEAIQAAVKLCKKSAPDTEKVRAAGMLYCLSRIRSASFLMIPSVRQCGCSRWILVRPLTP